jgi:hypothetical protein
MVVAETFDLPLLDFGRVRNGRRGLSADTTGLQRNGRAH